MILGHAELQDISIRHLPLPAIAQKRHSENSMILSTVAMQDRFSHPLSLRMIQHGRRKSEDTVAGRRTMAESTSHTRKRLILLPLPVHCQGSILQPPSTSIQTPLLPNSSPSTISANQYLTEVEDIIEIAKLLLTRLKHLYPSLALDPV